MQTTRVPESDLVQKLKKQGFIAVKAMRDTSQQQLGRDLVDMGIEILTQKYEDTRILPSKQVLSDSYTFTDKTVYVAYAKGEPSVPVIMARIRGPSGHSFLQL